MKHVSKLLTVNLLLLPLLGWGFNVSFSSPVDTVDQPLRKEGKVNAITEKPRPGYRVQTVVVDAGHGGHDSGCLGRNSMEKHLALGISLKVADLLRARFPDLQVILTRDSDVFVPLYERAAIANRSQADLFISIHCNFMPKLDWVRGSETYVMGLHTAEHNLDVAKRENAAILLEKDYEKNYDYDPNSPEGHIMLSMVQNVFLDQSILFAEMVERQIHEYARRKSRGVKQAGFVVLKETMMPSVLVEAGFLSNSGEEQYLKTRNGQLTMAESIVEAFAEYKGAVEENPQELALMENLVAAQEAKAEPESKPGEPADQAGQAASTPVAAFQWNQPVDPPGPAATRVEEEKLPASEPEKQEAEKALTSPAKSRGQANVLFVRETMSEPAPPAVDSPETRLRTDLPVIYRIQLAASSEPLPADDHQFDAVERPVEVVQEDGLYKYQVIRVDSFEDGMEYLQVLRLRGFVDAFLVAYQDGKRVNLSELSPSSR